MNILALDLGTNTGFAYNRGPEELVKGVRIPWDRHCGTWVLGTTKEIRQWGKDRLTRTQDPRIERLCKNLSGIGTFDMVVFEDVQFASSTYQVQLWSSLRATTILCSKTCRFDCVPVGTLKKFATGSGGADKSSMSKFLKARHPEWWTPNLDDNAVDAVWVWLWARQQFGRMK